MLRKIATISAWTIGIVGIIIGWSMLSAYIIAGTSY